MQPPSPPPANAQKVASGAFAVSLLTSMISREMRSSCGLAVSFALAAAVGALVCVVSGSRVKNRTMVFLGGALSLLSVLNILYVATRDYP